MKKIIIDVRETDEYADGHARGALNIPLSTLPGGLSVLTDVSKEDDEIVLYCRSGGRAGSCVSMFHKMGYKHVVNGINKEHVHAHHL